MTDAALVPAQPPLTDNLLAMIERAARDPAVDVAKFERLLAIRRELDAERARLEFAAAFADLGPDLPSVDRKGKIVVYSKAARERPGGPTEADAPIQSTPYAHFEDILEACRAPLAAHGFAIRFEYETAADGKLIVAAILQHRGGHAERAACPPLMHDSTGSKNNVQAIGSSLSYGMRYAFRAVVPVVSHASEDADDDGQGAGDPHIDPDQAADIEARLAATSSKREVFLTWVGAKSVEEMTVEQYKRAVAYLAEKAKRQTHAA